MEITVVIIILFFFTLFDSECRIGFLFIANYLFRYHFDYDNDDDDEIVLYKKQYR